jgi:predicted ATPase with chaperone activity
VRERVATARTVQAKRFKGTRLLTNADMRSAEVAMLLNNQSQLQLPADDLRALPARIDHWVDNQRGVSDISVEASSAPIALSRP